MPKRLRASQRITLRLFVILGLCAAAGCMTAKKREEAVYGPTESIIEVVAVLRRHIPDDTYRFAPANDFTGRNVYRSTLLRLENLEKLHADALRAGHLEGTITFAKARSLERLRAYDLAAQHYRKAGKTSPRLAAEAQKSAEICEEINQALRIGIDLPDPLSQGRSEKPLSPDAEKVVADLDARNAQLSALIDRDPTSHYVFVIREELERSDVVRAHYFVATRHTRPGGQIRAVSEVQRVASRHAASKNKRRHLLDVADFYALLAEEYTKANPPESLRFDPVLFQELVDAASQIYQSVATEDGTPEKLEAARRFEAFLAFTLQVDRDRFTQ